AARRRFAPASRLQALRRRLEFPPCCVSRVGPMQRILAFAFLAGLSGTASAAPLLLHSEYPADAAPIASAPVQQISAQAPAAQPPNLGGGFIELLFGG